jgi:glycosyltransferase involved in cell wall biosynthesis
VTALLASGLARRGHEVSILTLTGSEDPFYELDPAVKLVPMGVHWGTQNLWRTFHKNFARIRAIRRELRATRPDVLIGMMTECNVLAVLAGRIAERMPFPVIVSERVHPALTNRRALACAARFVTFPFADALTTCSRGMAPWYERWLPKQKVVPIQNPVVLEGRPEDPAAEALAARMRGERHLLAMGRLAPQKGFDMLLEAYARLPLSTRRGWSLAILGEGGQRQELQAQIKRLGLLGEAHLLGRYANPYPILRAGDIFCLSSRYEGFPNALTEAMACGLPAVAFDCLTGPSEIIREGEDGLLVPPGDVEGLSEALGRLMRDDALRQRMARRAPQVGERFGLEGFLDRWEGLLRKIRMKG